VRSSPTRSALFAGALAAIAACAGCSGGTSILVELSAEAGAAIPAGVDVSVYAERGALTLGRRVPTPSLPGRLVVRGLPDVDQPVRLVVRGGGLLGGTAVMVRAGQQVEARLTLAASTADVDGDGVPDALDVCPTVADPAQDDTDGDGRGDACATGDAGAPTDGGASGVDGGPSRCPVVGALLCEGFEGALDTTTWTMGGGPAFGTVEIDRTRAFRGGSSLKVSIDPTPPVDLGARYSAAEIFEYDTFPQSPIYVRVFLWVEQMPTRMKPQLLLMQQNPAPYAGMLLDYDNPFLASSTFGYDPPRTGSSATQLPKGRWACVEWMVRNGTPDAGATDGESRVWLDGVELTDLYKTGLTFVPPFGKLGVGTEIVTYPGQPGFSIWYDELVVSATRVGCDL